MPRIQLSIFVLRLFPFPEMRYEIPFVVGFVFVFHFVHVMHFISCHHVHLICIRVRLMHPNIFPVVRFAIRHSHMHRRTPSCFFSCAGVVRFRNGPRFVKWPWYTTGRPPIKFHAICSLFDTPTVNRGTVKASCVLQPNTPPKWPNNPSKPPPSSRPFDHDRVTENRTPFGLS